MKGTIIFGGSQTLTILINVIRGKLIAMILGAYGMGVSSLLMSALNPFQQLFTLSLPTSAVRSISLETGNNRMHTIIAFQRMMLWLSVAGMLAMMATSSLLSQTTFGDRDHTLWFIGLGISLFFLMQTAGESAILQGFRKIKQLATVAIVAPSLGLLVGIPFYYYWNVEGIVPAMIIINLASWITARHFTRELRPKRLFQSRQNTWKIGRGMLTLGAAMMLSGFIGTVVTYLLNTFIRTYSIEDVGLYQAACGITLQCTSMIFASMAADYFPHLSTVVQDLKDTRQLVEQEGEIVLLIMTPITLLLIFFAPTIVYILLTPQFTCIIPTLRMIGLSFIARAFCFPQDYVCIAKGDKTYFFWVEGVFTNAKTLLIYALGYYFFGFIGLGYGAIVNCIVDIISSAILNQWRFSVHYSLTYFRLFLPCVLLASICMLASLIDEQQTSYQVMAITTLLSCLFSYWQLDKRLNLKEIIKLRKIRRK